ncbi:2-oxo acid dehydrogenase subunit E2 [Novosphingobium sp. FSY-8]|uniref:Dihydrolipoamide acetyltransferase component of pyruvate dehydrogenase complex n=1 Tax=Novosphingobium ovatum TaxID=1908523 RepID=A0ABW9XHU0_9SPHN|nr:2-oxo acid dehydrogenase subunit E2 [Novosphingobium ovatum]NBC38113.1 2-oxo acid dehydrogenase subunit E2 [Novosphingobium ovatum]
MPDIRPFCMPKWGIEMTEGTLAEWMVAEGETFSKGQLLCLIETAKITNEVEAEYDAVLARVLVPAGGAEQPVGALLAVTAAPGTDAAEIDAFIAAFKPADTSVAARGGSSDAAPAPAAAAAAPVTNAPRKIETNRPISPEALKFAEDNGVDIDPIVGSGRGGRITLQDVHQAARYPANPALTGTLSVEAEDRAVFASPLARRIAAQHGISLSGVKGTGPRGRISKADVLALVPAPASAAPAAFGAPFVAVANTPTVTRFDSVRKVVAQRLTEAKQTIPHFYLRMSANVDKLMELRKTANLVLGCKASLNDYVVMASARALAQHRDVNVQVHGQEIHSFPHADISIAVASPKGLVTPVVRQADRMRIDQIASATSALIEKAKSGRLGMDDMAGGSFSISNLGMFGIEDFDAIINPPQGAILAVGTITREAVEDGEGFAFESRMRFTLSVDHRAIDGAGGAQFLATLKSLLENPETLFA